MTLVGQLIKPAQKLMANVNVIQIFMEEGAIGK